MYSEYIYFKSMYNKNLIYLRRNKDEFYKVALIYFSFTHRFPKIITFKYSCRLFGT